MVDFTRHEYVVGGSLEARPEGRLDVLGAVNSDAIAVAWC